MTKLGFIVLVSLLFSVEVLSQQPKVLLMDGARISSLKTKLKTDKKLYQLVSNLQVEADKFLNMKPVSVMDKTFTPASGNKHDYMSQAPYFWYDSSKPNGLPYLRRDGVRNPEILKITDRKNIGDLSDATRTLALTFYLTNDEKYAAKAAMLLKHWFLNEDTKMNPNLDYAQAIPGVNSGRGIGIIETIALTGIADASVLLEGSESWNKHDQDNLKQWYKRYLKWMQSSRNGKEEMKAENNHGTFYDMQVVDFALFTGKKKIAKKTLKHSKKRLEVQIESDGKMPLELERTQALWYTTYNLEGWFKLATLAEHAGVDLWNYSAKNGASIKKTLDWIAPYAIGERPWPHQQIDEYKPHTIYTLFMQAAKKYNDNKYLELANKTNAKVNTFTALMYQ